MKKTFLFTLLMIYACCAGKLLAQDVYEVKFTSGFTQHRAAMVLFDDDTGIMRVRYYSNGDTRMVEQTLRLDNTIYGIRIAGYDPVYPGTTTRHPSYMADNFYLSQDEYGNSKLVNIDDGGNTAACTLRVLEGKWNQNNFLADFDWSLK